LEIIGSDRSWGNCRH